MKLWKTAFSALALGAALGAPAEAQTRDEFNLAWSIYVGWMPWGYADEAGIVDRWAERYGITINVTQFNDYVESVNQYTAGGYDAVTITNMDALSIPAAGGVDTTALIIGDFSSGNDAVILKGEDDLQAIAGQTVNLVELSVSHYLLARALDTIGLTERDISVLNTSDADIAAAFQAPETTAVVTWNPLVSEILADPAAHSVFDSSQIPGEILDMLVVNTQVLEDNPDLGRALVGIWYETLALMTADTPEGAAARESMGRAAGTDREGFEAQLGATELFATPRDALAFVTSPTLPTTMERVRAFLFEKGLLGPGAPSPDVVGIEFPDGSIMGDAENVRLRFTDSFVREIENGF